MAKPYTKFIMLNTQFITVSTRFIVLNAKFIEPRFSSISTCHSSLCAPRCYNTQAISVKDCP